MSQLTYSHDQAQRIQKDVLAEVYNEVDEQVERSLLDGRPDIALGYAESLLITGHLRGVQLMKLFYELSQVWDKFETDDTMEDYIFNHLGVSGRKLREYVGIYQHILKDHPKLTGKPIIGLIGILVAAREGEFNEDDWDDLAKAPDASTMFDIRRQVRGVQTSGSNRLVLTWERDGQVYCRRGDTAKKHLGFLTRDDDDDDVVAGVLRMIENGKVMVK